MALKKRSDSKIDNALRQLDRGDRLPVFSIRFVLAVILVVVGLAWIVFYYTVVRPGDDLKAGGPKVLGDWANWNYLIGFGLFFLGLFVSAHPSTPMGRNRGVVIGMLGCFLLGLAWICLFYIFSDDLTPIWVMNDLGQKNLFVGISFMATGFAFATRWE